MEHQETLTKAISQAIQNGWDGTEVWTVDLTPEGASKAVLQYHNPSLGAVIYNHDFAKALWGTEMVSTFPWAEDGSYKYQTEVEAWMHHLQQMVIAPDPIVYLAEHI